MRIVNIAQDQAGAEFAGKAASAMAANPKLYTWAEGDPTAGELLAIRWNSFTVLVVRLDECCDVSLYATNQLIGEDLPPLEGGAA